MLLNTWQCVSASTESLRSFHELPKIICIGLKFWRLESCDINWVLCGSICSVTTYMDRDPSACWCGTPFVSELSFSSFRWKRRGSKVSVWVSGQLSSPAGGPPKATELLQSLCWALAVANGLKGGGGGGRHLSGSLKEVKRKYIHVVSFPQWQPKSSKRSLACLIFSLLFYFFNSGLWGDAHLFWVKISSCRQNWRNRLKDYIAKCNFKCIKLHVQWSCTTHAYICVFSEREGLELNYPFLEEWIFISHKC